MLVCESSSTQFCVSSHQQQTLCVSLCSRRVTAHSNTHSLSPTPHSHPPQEKNIQHKGSVTFNDIIEVARVMRPRSCAKSLAGTCKEILGTAVSVGCKVDHKHPSAIMEMVSVCAACPLAVSTRVACTHTRTHARTYVHMLA